MRRHWPYWIHLRVVKGQTQTLLNYRHKSAWPGRAQRKKYIYNRNANEARPIFHPLLQKLVQFNDYGKHTSQTTEKRNEIYTRNEKLNAKKAEENCYILIWFLSFLFCFACKSNGPTEYDCACRFRPRDITRRS